MRRRWISCEGATGCSTATGNPGGFAAGGIRGRLRKLLARALPDWRGVPRYRTRPAAFRNSALAFKNGLERAPVSDRIFVHEPRRRLRDPRTP